MFNGLGLSMANLSRVSDAQTRSISAENFTGEKGMGGAATEGTGKNCARELGRGWKISPSIVIKAGETAVIADITGSGAIQHIWMTPSGNRRYSIVRMYWDGCDIPSVECPIGDFFASAYQDGGFSQISSLPVCVNPGSGFNCYWEMPFRTSCKITVENTADDDMTLYYQIDYTLTEVPEDCAYFHAHFNRTNPLPYMSDYVILDGVQGKGQYVGTYLAWGVNNNGWWGEGEIKFFIDGDREFPTICGTGTEDYFGGSYNFDVNGEYRAFTTPYTGMYPTRTDGLYKSQQRFSLYRWHVTDPVRFDSDLKVTVQALGWRSGQRYLPLMDDIASVAFWYQDKPSLQKRNFPSRDELEII